MENTGIELVGEIRKGVNAYYDQYSEEGKFLIGYRGKAITFVVGCTKDLAVFKKALENYDEKTRVKTIKL